MVQSFSLAVELLDREIETVRHRLEQLVSERDALRARLAGNGGEIRVFRSTAVAVTESERPMVLHEAIDLVLSKADQPLAVKELHRRVLGHRLNSNPSATTVRGALNAKCSEYGWQKRGTGRATRWLKPHAQEASA